MPSGATRPPSPTRAMRSIVATSPFARWPSSTKPSRARDTCADIVELTEHQHLLRRRLLEAAADDHQVERTVDLVVARPRLEQEREALDPMQAADADEQWEAVALGGQRRNAVEQVIGNGRQAVISERP